MIDPAQFQQMLMNLINNAAGAMKDSEVGSPRLRLWLRWLSASRELELGTIGVEVARGGGAIFRLVMPAEPASRRGVMAA